MTVDRPARAAPRAIDWARPAVSAAVPPDGEVVVIGPMAVAWCEALSTGTRVVRAGSVDALDLAGADVVVLAESPCWVDDDIAHLREVVRAAGRDTVMVVAVPNVTWLPNRADALVGRSPFGTGPIEERPLRFFARTTILDALASAGLVPVALEAVSEPVDEASLGLDPALEAAVATAPDGDVVGFVVTAASAADRPVGGDGEAVAEAPGSDEPRPAGGNVSDGGRVAAMVRRLRRRIGRSA